MYSTGTIVSSTSKCDYMPATASLLYAIWLCVFTVRKNFSSAAGSGNALRCLATCIAHWLPLVRPHRLLTRLQSAHVSAARAAFALEIDHQIPLQVVLLDDALYHLHAIAAHPVAVQLYAADPGEMPGFDCVSED